MEESFSVFHVDSKNLFTIISENQKKRGSYDLVIIGTAHRYFNTFLEISQHFHTSIIVHNLNFIKLNSFQLIQNIFKKETVFRLKLLFKEGLLSKSKLYKSAHSLLVLDSNLVQKTSKYQYLPIFYANEAEDQTSDHLSIVIPGNVSQERRDYKSVLAKAANWSQNNPNLKLEIVLLGKAGKPELQWLKDFENLNLPNIKMIYFEEKVPQNVFDIYLTNATYLWCPLQISTSFFSNEEIYGITKMSGIIADVIQYKKLAFLPKVYPSDYPFIKADTLDLDSQIASYLNQPLPFNFNEFIKANVLAKLEELLHKLAKQT